MPEKIKIKKTTLNAIGLLVIIAVIASYFIFFSAKGSVTSNVEESGNIGTAVGDFAPSLAFETIDGQTLTVDDLKGERVILQGFASWCPSCKIQAQEIKIALASLDNVRVVSLDIWEGETADDVRNNFIIGAMNNDVPENWVFTAYEPDFVTTYQLYSMDATYILNERGVIIFKDPDVTRAEKFLEILGGE